MTQNEVDIIKNAVLDATEAYVDARLGTAAFVKTQIGVVVSAAQNTQKKWVHKVRCNQTSNTQGIIYDNVLSVNNIHFTSGSTVFILAPNAQFSNQFILGKLDNVPYDIVGGSININDKFKVYSNGNVECLGTIQCNNLTANVTGYIGGFEITPYSLGDPMGTSIAVGMEREHGGSRGHLYVVNYSSSSSVVHAVRIYNDEIEIMQGMISVNDGDSWVHMTGHQVQSNDKGYVVWHSELSDKRYKNNINKISSEKIQKFYNELEPYSFKFNEDIEDKDDSIHYGVVAQNLQTALNTAQLDSASLVKENKKKDMLLVDYQELHGLELAGIKDLYKQIDALKAQIEAK